MKQITLPTWFPPGTGTNVDWAEGWNACLLEVTKRLEEAGVEYVMEDKFGEGSKS